MIYNEKNTIICIKYKQIGEHKKIQIIYEINYNQESHNMLFGNLPKDVIKSYVNGVKSIPKQ